MRYKLNSMDRIDEISFIDEFISAVRQAAETNTLLGLTLAKPAGDATKTTVRPVGDAFQLAWQIGPRQHHRNVSADELTELLSAQLPASFKHAHAFTTTADVSLLVSKKGKASLQRKRPSKSYAVAGGEHDRQRSYIIPDGEPCEFLQAAGVMLPSGRVPKAKWSKFRQINRFLELVDDVYPMLPADGVLSVVEFGSGKSHLTFALHHLLTQHHDRAVSMRAVDRMTSVVEAAQAMTGRLSLRGIRHEASDIADIAIDGPLHLAVWLHACDTATDDALAKSIAAGADVILAVPCCQHEVLHRMQSTSLLDQYGILKERRAALATDALRAAALEICGYKTQVVEFIDLEHTAKNVLLRAVKRSQPIDVQPWREKYAALKTDLGLDSWRLEELLGEQLHDSQVK